jgi:hypothetical protein
MAYQFIPTDSSSLFFEQQTQLEGLQYILRFWWSNREGCYYLGIYDQGANAIATGIKLVVSWPLLRRFQDPRLPAGVLGCVDMTGMGEDIAVPTDLGDRVKLFYITSDDPSLA